MGRRRRNRKRPEDTSPQGELLNGAEGEESPGDDPSPEPGDDPSPEPGDDPGARADVDTEEGLDDGQRVPSAVPPGASVVLGPEWPGRVAELEDIHDLEGALAVVRNERKQRPDDIPLIQAEIRLLGSLGRFDAAADPLAHLRQVADDPALVHRVAGVLLFRRGTYPEAMEELRASAAAADSVGETFYYLGETLNRLGRVEEALEALRRAVELDPGLGRAYSTMGRLLDRKGEPDEAALMHRKAREAER